MMHWKHWAFFFSAASFLQAAWEAEVIAEQERRSWFSAILAEEIRVLDTFDHPDYIDLVNESGCNCVHLAIRRCPFSLAHLKRLVAWQGKVNHTDSSGTTPLMYLLSRYFRGADQRVEAVAYLLSVGADPRIANAKKQTALTRLEELRDEEKTQLRSLLQTAARELDQKERQEEAPGALGDRSWVWVP